LFSQSVALLVVYEIIYCDQFRSAGLNFNELKKIHEFYWILILHLLNSRSMLASPCLNSTSVSLALRLNIVILNLHWRPVYRCRRCRTSET